MANASSLIASYSLGIQADKDTAATAFITGLKTQSNVPGPRWDTYDPGPEHPGPTTRNSAKRSYDERTGYVAPFGSTGLLYPRLVGTQLVGIGMEAATTDNTTHYSHAFTMALADAVGYLSAIYQATDTAWQRMITGGRLSSLQFTADPQNEIQVVDQGLGLVVGAPAGGETFTDEEAQRIKATKGTATINVNSVAFTRAIRGFQVTFTQSLDEQDFQLLQAGRADLPQNSLGIEGEIQQIDLYEDDYQLIQNGAIGATDPDVTVAKGDIAIKFESAANISGAAVPYSLEFVFPAVQFVMGEFPASGEDPMRYALQFAMVDAPGGPAEPVTVNLVNDVAAY